MRRRFWKCNLSMGPLQWSAWAMGSVMPSEPRSQAPEISQILQGNATSRITCSLNIFTEQLGSCFWRPGVKTSNYAEVPVCAFLHVCKHAAACTLSESSAMRTSDDVWPVIIRSRRKIDGVLCVEAKFLEHLVPSFVFPCFDWTTWLGHFVKRRPLFLFPPAEMNQWRVLL